MFKNGTSSGNQIVVRRNAAIGDCVAATVVIDKLIDLGYDPIYQTHPAIHCLLRRHPRLQHFEETANNRYIDVNLDGAYEKDPLRRQRHFYDMFLSKSNDQLARLGINLGGMVNCKPQLRVSPAERHAAQLKFKEYPRPWIFVCPRSDTYQCRTVPDGIWMEASKRIAGTKFWIGRHPAPPHFVDLKCNHLDNVLVWLSAADLLVTVDTGPMHMAAAMGIPILALCQSSSPELHLGDQVDFMTLSPKGLDCLNCQQNVCPLPNMRDTPPCQKFDPEIISAWANRKAQQIYGNDTSAIIPVYGSDPDVIRRCLDCITPQVQEVVVTAETEDKVPKGVVSGGKIRGVVKGVKGIGYGRNVNFGVRNSTGKNLMIINDDVFIDPGCVETLLRQLKDNVGCVSARLMYPDGTVYFAGKVRGPAEMGWGHKNHRQRHWDIKEPIEMENGYQAASLVSRKAFYHCGAFDERFFCYADDDAISLQLRRAGWKIVFEPNASGIHLEGQSTRKLGGDRMNVVRKANKTFDSVWGWYLRKNSNTIPGTFD